MRCSICGSIFDCEHEECISCGQFYEKSNCRYALICEDCCAASCKCSVDKNTEEE